MSVGLSQLTRSDDASEISRMNRLREEFPLLSRVPRPMATLGLSLDSDLAELQAKEVEELLPALVDHLLANGRRKLKELATGVNAISDYPIAIAVREKRARKALSRAGVQTWGDLAEFSPSDLTRFSGMSVRAASAVLTALVWLLFSGEIEQYRQAWAKSGPRDEALEASVETLRLFATWAARENATERLGDLLQSAEIGLHLPPDLDRRRGHLVELEPQVLAYAPLVAVALEDLVDDLLESLGDTERGVYELRVLSEPKVTLEEVGCRFHFTRERARQLQISAQDCIDSLLACRRFLPLHWRAHQMRLALGRCAPRQSLATADVLAKCLRDVTPGARPTVERLLLLLAGPYRERDGWLELENERDVAVSALAKLADENGLLPIATAYEWLGGHGVVPAFQDAWIKRSGKLRREDTTLIVWSGSIVDKSVALLALRGTPADSETLVAAVSEGHSVRSAQNAFLTADRLVRVNRGEWALRAWGLEEYTGITDEIAQRIAEAGGRARLVDVVEELVNQFDVKERSVKVYAEAPMFVLESGWVRLRSEAEPFPILQDLTTCPGVYKWSTERTSVLVQVDGEALRGSGRPFPAAVAAAFGVMPGKSRSFVWDDGCLTVQWSMTAALGPSLGSVRALAREAHAREGDSLRLDFKPLSERVGFVLVPHSLEGFPAPFTIRLLTGLPSESDPLGQLASALTVAPSDVKRVLIERGDDLVADLLPAADLDSSLEAALADLADSLETSE